METHAASDGALRLFSEKSESYVRFIRAVRYPQGLRAFFLASPLLRPGLRVLDAGCGSGALALGLHEALVRRGCAPGVFHAFDLTPAMLDRFRAALRERALAGVELAQANVLDLAALPPAWSGYDLVVSASMLEYLPRERLPEALRGLRLRLRPGGTFLLFVTRRNWLTRPLIGRWWQSNLYRADELRQAFRAAGFTTVSFRSFPRPFQYLSLWGHIVEASAASHGGSGGPA